MDTLYNGDEHLYSVLILAGPQDIFLSLLMKAPSLFQKI